MGGNAFNSAIHPSSFPRLPPAVYQALKDRFRPKLQQLYSLVAVPFEAPEKTDHGDLDFVVACPKPDSNGIPSEAGSSTINVPQENVREAIGARYLNPMEGNRTSNFAVPVGRGEWGPLAHGEEEQEKRRDAEGGEIFYQVDVHVCTDKAEWEGVVFFNSYGDLGMILGLIVKNNSLALGSRGLKLPNPPHPPVELSASFDEIMDFMGLSMDTWKAGFKTKRQVFEWVGTSRFFDPRRFKSEGPGIRKVKPERKMYGEFVHWAIQRGAEEATTQGTKEESEARQSQAKNDALIFFNKKDEFDALNLERSLRSRMKETFNGSRVREWAGLGDYWFGVKMIMTGVRERVGGDEGVSKLLEEEGEEGIKNVVLEIKKELKLLSSEEHARQRQMEGLAGEMADLGIREQSEVH